MELLLDVVFTECNENVLPRKTLAHFVCFDNRFSSRYDSYMSFIYIFAEFRMLDAISYCILIEHIGWKR